jgi:hypothetical protein
VVQSLLGRSDGRMTQRYAHLRVESLREAVKTLDEGHKRGHMGAQSSLGEGGVLDTGGGGYAQI